MDEKFHINIYVNGKVSVDMTKIDEKTRMDNIEKLFKELGIKKQKAELVEEPTIYDYSKKNVLDTSTYARV